MVGLTELDTSAYTPASETEEEENPQEEPDDGRRTRYQIPADSGQINRLHKQVDELEEQVREGTEFHSRVQTLQNLLDRFDARKYLKMYVYKCDRCGETFDTKTGIGVHQHSNPNCNGEDRPWNNGEPTKTKIRVEDL